MRELFGPVSTNVNWYNDGARGYNKKRGEGGGRANGRTGGRASGRGRDVKVLSRFSNKLRHKEPQRFHANVMRLQPVSI